MISAMDCAGAPDLNSPLAVFRACRHQSSSWFLATLIFARMPRNGNIKPIHANITQLTQAARSIGMNPIPNQNGWPRKESFTRSVQGVTYDSAITYPNCFS